VASLLMFRLDLAKRKGGVLRLKQSTPVLP